MERVKLEAATREVLGKKVRFLRRQGIIPASLHGHDSGPVALQVESSSLKRALAKAGRNTPIALAIAGSRGSTLVIIRDMQKDPLSDKLLHVDFYEIKATERIKVKVPLILVGEAAVARGKDVMVLQELSLLEIECLPDDIPHTIEVDVSGLKEIDQAIHVKDIPLPGGITLVGDAEGLVVRVARTRIGVTEEVEGAGVAETETAESEKQPLSASG